MGNLLLAVLITALVIIAIIAIGMSFILKNDKIKLLEQLIAKNLNQIKKSEPWDKIDKYVDKFVNWIYGIKKKMLYIKSLVKSIVCNTN